MCFTSRHPYHKTGEQIQSLRVQQCHMPPMTIHFYTLLGLGTKPQKWLVWVMNSADEWKKLILWGKRLKKADTQLQNVHQPERTWQQSQSNLNKVVQKKKKMKAEATLEETHNPCEWLPLKTFLSPAPPPLAPEICIRKHTASGSLLSTNFLSWSLESAPWGLSSNVWPPWLWWDWARLIEHLGSRVSQPYVPVPAHTTTSYDVLEKFLNFSVLKFSYL